MELDLPTIFGFFNWGAATPAADDTWLARWMGLYITIMCLLVLIRLEHVRTLADTFKKNPAFMALSGSVSLLLGTLLVALHPQFVANWTVLITIIGYLSILKGILRLFGNGWCSKWCSVTQQNEKFLVGWSIVWLVVGLVLIWFGYFA